MDFGAVAARAPGKVILAAAASIKVKRAVFIRRYRHLSALTRNLTEWTRRKLGCHSMPLAVHRGDGKLEGGHSTPRRQVPNVGVRFAGLGTHEETVGFRPV